MSDTESKNTTTAATDALPTVDHAADDHAEENSISVCFITPNKAFTVYVNGQKIAQFEDGFFETAEQDVITALREMKDLCNEVPTVESPGSRVQGSGCPGARG